jgi:hypothetical protein
MIRWIDPGNSDDREREGWEKRKIVSILWNSKDTRIFYSS